jgi:hypothetical protein
MKTFRRIVSISISTSLAAALMLLLSISSTYVNVSGGSVFAAQGKSGVDKTGSEAKGGQSERNTGGNKEANQGDKKGGQCETKGGGGRHSDDHSCDAKGKPR